MGSLHQNTKIILFDAKICNFTADSGMIERQHYPKHDSDGPPP
jgi:hypothetical protein